MSLQWMRVKKERKGVQKIIRKRKNNEEKWMLRKNGKKQKGKKEAEIMDTVSGRINRDR